MNAEQMIDKFDAESLWQEAGSVMLETHSNGASATGASDLSISSGQRLAASYQALIDILAKRFSEVQQRTEAAQAASLTSTGHNNSLGGNEPIGPARNILLHDYEVDASEEPCVYGSLAGMQLESMQAIVERMMSLVRDWQWVAHEQMLKKLEEDVQRLARVCKAGTS
ncbi:MAG: hypothetical protein MMC23_004677 [Stictis urceolatum]|nr:hypothetical protein [Stictis urceolata]